MDRVLAEIEKPDLENFSSDRFGSDSLVIFCAGFEDRSVALANRLRDDGASGFRALVVEYLPAVSENRIQELVHALESASALVDIIQYDRENPDAAGERIAALASQYGGTVTVDISGMSRLLIVQIVTAFCDAELLQSTSVVYAEASEYPPSRDEFEIESHDHPSADLAFLSSGVFELTLVPELSSVVLQQRPIHAVLFPSFNRAQTLNVCSELQASRWTIVNGVPPADENRWRTTAISEMNYLDVFRSADQRTASTLDYRETLALLLEIYNESAADHRVVVAPTGSKMQSVAVGIFRGFMKDVQIIYPTPSKFKQPNRYTRGVRQILQLPLGAFEYARASDSRTTLNRRDLIEADRH